MLHEHIRPVDIVFSENYMIVQSDVKNDEKQLYVYDKNTHKFLFSFANRGNGHNETIAMDMVQNPEGDTLKLIDQARYKILTYVLTNDSAIFIDDDRIKMKSKGPLQEVYLHNDSVLLFYTLENIIYTYNTRQHKVIDEFIFPDIHKDLSTEDKMTCMSFHLAYFNGKMCVGFEHVNCLTTGYIDENNKIFIDTERVERHKGEPVDKDMMHYMYVDMDGDNIIAEYMGYEISLLSRFTKPELPLADLRFYIEQYDSRLNPKAFLAPVSDIFRVKLNSKDKSVYTWNPLDKDEHLLKIKIN